MRSSEKVLPAILAVALLLIAAVPVDPAAGEESITIDTTEFDAVDRILTVGGATSLDIQVIYFSFLGTDGKVVMQGGFAPVENGRFHRDVLVPDSVPEGSYVLRAYASSTLYAERMFTVTEASLGLNGSSVSLTVGSSASVGISLDNAEYSDLRVMVSDPTVASAEIKDGKLVVKGSSIGSTRMLVYLVDDKGKPVDGVSAELVVTVSAAPVVKELRKYTFFIQITKDMDKADTSPYSESDLRSGITISAEEYDAAAALQKACDAQGIDCSMNDTPTDIYYGWILSLFGLEQYQTPGTEAWTYWIQYHNGSYNQWTLGHYTDGGSFSLIWGTTLPDGSDPDGDKDQSTPSVDSGGSTTTTTTTEDKKEDGSTETTTEVKKEDQDGSSATTTTTEIRDPEGNKVGEETTESVVSADGGSKESVSRTEISEDGSSKTSSTTTETDRFGNETRTEEESSTVKDADGKETTVTVTKTTDSDGNVSESRTESVAKESVDDSGRTTTEVSSRTEHGDGTVVESESVTVVAKDGTTTEVTTEKVTKDGTTTEVRKETESSVSKGSDGSETTKTVETVSSADSVQRTESVETVKKDGSRTSEVTTVSSDKDGNVLGSTTRTTETKTSGATTTTRTTETSEDADGKATGSKETTTVNGSGRTTTTEVSKDADGKETSRTVTERKDSTGRDGSKVIDVTTTSTAGDVRTDSVLKRTESADGSERTSSITTTETTSAGSRTETSNSRISTTDEGVSRTYVTGERVSDVDGNVTGETRTEKESVETSVETTEAKRTETTSAGSTVKDESVTVSAKDGSVRTETSYSSKDGSVVRAESTTVISASGSEIGADAARAAVEQSAAAISRTTADETEMRKTFEVSGSEGTSVTVAPDALGLISGHGASLKVGGSDGVSSIHVDEDVVKGLSEGSSGTDASLSMSLREGGDSDLGDAQKDAVGNGFFIVLSATLGDSRVHSLGGTATVTFGYILPEGTDASKLYISYVDDQGRKTRMASAAYDASTGTFTMQTDHFSVFMVETEEDEPEPGPAPLPPEDDGDAGDDGTLIHAAVAAVIAALAIAAFVVLRRGRA